MKTTKEERDLLVGCVEEEWGKEEDEEGFGFQGTFARKVRDDLDETEAENARLSNELGVVDEARLVVLRELEQLRAARSSEAEAFHGAHSENERLRGEVKRWKAVAKELACTDSFIDYTNDIKGAATKGDLPALEAALGITPQSDTEKETK